MRISDWSSDVCSSDLRRSRSNKGDWNDVQVSSIRSKSRRNSSTPYLVSCSQVKPSTCRTFAKEILYDRKSLVLLPFVTVQQLGRALCRERVCQDVSI